MKTIASQAVAILETAGPGAENIYKALFENVYLPNCSSRLFMFYEIVLIYQNSDASKLCPLHIFPLKFLIANWDALIPFRLVSFFCLKSKNLSFNFYFLS